MVDEPEVVRAAEVINDPVTVEVAVVIAPAIVEEEGDETVLLDMTVDEEVVCGEVTMLDETVPFDLTDDVFEDFPLGQNN